EDNTSEMHIVTRTIVVVLGANSIIYGKRLSKAYFVKAKKILIMTSFVEFQSVTANQYRPKGFTSTPPKGWG
ncbi:MAG: hypothetical protein ACUVRR_13660, partial [Candidatus Fervidibacter sp.]|uniref:hypothetical protein n=1 Tax=Candidatus Fervidibacter sp. TaxID=3100871 RepID=UPI00404BA272